MITALLPDAVAWQHNAFPEQCKAAFTWRTFIWGQINSSASSLISYATLRWLNTSLIFCCCYSGYVKNLIKPTWLLGSGNITRITHGIKWCWIGPIIIDALNHWTLHNLHPLLFTCMPKTVGDFSSMNVLLKRAQTGCNLWSSSAKLKL